MPTQVICPSCGARLSISSVTPDATRLQCPRCRTALRWPPPDAAIKPASSVTASRSRSSQPTLGNRCPGEDTAPNDSPRRRDSQGTRSKPGSSAGRPGGGTARPRGWRKGWLLGSGLALLLALGAGLAAYAILRKPAPPALAESMPGRLVVRRDGSKGAYPSIAAALRAASDGSRIVVEAPTWDEVLNVDATVPRVKIEGGASLDAVRWSAPPGHRADLPLLRIAARSGLTVSGFVLDGEGWVEDLVVLAGECNGVTLDGLGLKGFRRAGIALRGCTAAEKPVTIEKVRIASGGVGKSALSFEGSANESNRNILVKDCRLEGPFTAAVVVDAPTTASFTHNRIYRAADAFLYRRRTPPGTLDLTLSGNAFCSVDKLAMHFETMPPEGGRIRLENNLFAHTARLAWVDDIDVQPAQTQAQWIWGDSAAAGAGGPPEQRYFRKSFIVSGASVEQAVLNIACDAAFTASLNGAVVGRGEFRPRPTGRADQLTRLHHPSGRVQALKVTGNLRPGVNTLAVDCTGAADGAGLLAELHWTGPRATSGAVVSDASWKVSDKAPPRWRQADFVDSGWPAARVVAPYGKGLLRWQNLVWDNAVSEALASRVGSLFANRSGNIGDTTSLDGYPALLNACMRFEFATNPEDAATFLEPPENVLMALADVPEQSDEPVDGGTYIITNVYSGKRLAIENGSRDSGGKLIQRDAKSTYNLWRLEKTGAHFHIVNTSNALVIDVPSGSTSPVQVIQWEPHGAANQEWSLVKAGPYYRIRAKHSQLELDCLSREEGGAVFQNLPDGSTRSQLWVLTAVGSRPARAPEDVRPVPATP